MLKPQDNPVSHRLLDSRTHQLVFLGDAATPELWDRLWSLDEAAITASLLPTRSTDLLVKFTRRFLSPEDGAVLEGGCGMGQFVAALTRGGFRSIGIDFAPETVRALNRSAPQLDVRLGDLRRIEMPDASVAGYWSLGVIEHFWGGYDALAREMARVVQDGGYLFCSFPYMSPFRRAKARLGLYQTKDFRSEPDGFYQFALRDDVVIERMAHHGFDLVERSASSALKGVLGECGPISAPLARLYYYRGRSIPVRAARRAAETVLASIGTSHSMLLVFRRRKRLTSGG